MPSAIIIGGIIILIAIILYLVVRLGAKETARIHRLPLRELGLTNIPAVPFILEEIPDTLVRLAARSRETLPAKYGLYSTWTIGGITSTAYNFMYGNAPAPEPVPVEMEMLRRKAEAGDRKAFLEPAALKELLRQPATASDLSTADPIQNLSLESPEQFTMSWTYYYNVYPKAEANFLPGWVNAITDVELATNQFWPIISKYGLAFNLLILQKANKQHLAAIKANASNELQTIANELFDQQRLYIIDLTIFNSLNPDAGGRFAPGTLTLLQQDATTKALTPFAITVSGSKSTNSKTYVKGVCSDSAWLYALQAAKVSITVYGIWIGHVYHWHIVTASMVMTMYNNLPATHPVYELLDTQSKYLIAFNEVLLLLWKNIAPPTAVSTAWQFLELMDTYGTGRNYFDDDPIPTLNKLGIKQEDFTADPARPWQQYPIVKQLLDIWGYTSKYVIVFVNNTYVNDGAVANDTALQAWMAAASSADDGNVRGLQPVNTRSALIDFLTSHLFRITVHGSSRLNDAANPGLSFIPNFPPCLEKTDIPDTNVQLSTEQLLKYMPKTGTIGQMITFLFTFSFSAAYDSLLPVQGIDSNLIFPGGTADVRNQALIEFRKDIRNFIDEFTAEGKTGDAPQYPQWPTSIET